MRKAILGNDSSRIKREENCQASSTYSVGQDVCVYKYTDLQLCLAITLKLCYQQIPNFSRAWRSVVLSPFVTGRVVISYHACIVIWLYIYFIMFSLFFSFMSTES